MAIRILLSPELVKDNNNNIDYADQMLHWFVMKSITLYGESIITYNVHSLVHLADDVRNHRQPFDRISAFPFENYLDKLKGLVHSGLMPIRQMVKRLDEHDKNRRPLLKMNPTQSIKSLDMPSTKIHDNVYLLKEGSYAGIDEVYKNSLYGRVFPKDRLLDLFNEPTSSHKFKISYISSMSNSITMKIPI